MIHDSRYTKNNDIQFCQVLLYVFNSRLILQITNSRHLHNSFVQWILLSQWFNNMIWFCDPIEQLFFKTRFQTPYEYLNNDFEFNCVTHLSQLFDLMIWHYYRNKNDFSPFFFWTKTENTIRTEYEGIGWIALNEIQNLTKPNKVKSTYCLP